MADPKAPSKPFSLLKLIWYGFILLGLVGLCLEAYWSYFKLKIWIAGFGVGFFLAFGLIGGFVYFYVVHKFHIELKVLPQGMKKFGLYAGFILGLLVLDPLPLSLALWLFSPLGTLHTDSMWFFTGTAVAAVIVLGLERLFKKKAPQALS